MSVRGPRNEKPLARMVEIMLFYDLHDLDGA